MATGYEVSMYRDIGRIAVALEKIVAALTPTTCTCGAPLVDAGRGPLYCSRTDDGQVCDSFDPADYEIPDTEEIAATGDLLCCCGHPLTAHRTS